MFGFGKKTSKYENIDAGEFQELMKDKDVVVLDVRTPAEKAEGTIPGYKMINLMSPDFANQVSQLDKSKKYLVYCRSGNRSRQACQIMAGMGFENLYNLVGGIGAWNSMKRYA
ncbi:rhodanese-like domain protein [Fulvivirga imtechensis AK7]|uniref:Rhodanese-like domain protein n=2 Tax=Fulvivirga TaxID=396811 RepID=L8JWG6_9BACT|nr:rhodanese-like domain-containing protein [Fulvivirga imtechensis]ELR73386.1 rhodanese-like domain protein [Fulvivirga imtechensis AK7]